MVTNIYDDLISVSYKLEKAATLIQGHDSNGASIILIEKYRIDNFVQEYIKWFYRASNIVNGKFDFVFDELYRGNHDYGIKEFLLNYEATDLENEWVCPAFQFVDALRKQRVILMESREQASIAGQSILAVVNNTVNINPIKIFDIQPVIKDNKLCFVMMPFANELQEIYEDCIKLAIEEEGLKCIRGDDIFQSGPIISQIWQQIMKAKLVIADLTKTNGNVMYELGLAHVVGHEAILLAQNMEDVPFDLRHQRVIIYTLTKRGMDKLKTDLQQFIRQAFL